MFTFNRVLPAGRAATATTVFALLAFLCCVPFGGSLCGAELSIVGPTDPIEAKQPVWLTIEGVEEGQAAMFWPETFLQVGPPHIVDLHALFWAEKPGVYSVKAVVVRIEMVGGQAIPYLTPLSFSVKVQGGGDDEDDDDPDPPPLADYRGMIIEESSDRTAQQAAIIVSTKLKSQFEPQHWRVWDINAKDSGGNTPAGMQPWFGLAKKVGLPALFLYDRNGTVAFKGPLPSTLDETLAVIAEHRPAAATKPGPRRWCDPITGRCYTY